MTIERMQIIERMEIIESMEIIKRPFWVYNMCHMLGGMID